jgi:hypothetical protein
MDKQVLRAVISGLSVDDVLTVNFRSTCDKQSGEYNFEGSRRGRGKGGSLLAELTEVTEDNLGVNSVKEVVVIGTPTNDEILNLVVNGEVHGYQTENEVPLFFETNAGTAAALKESFRVFLNDGACPKAVEVWSTHPALNGTFNVTRARQLRGRGGQVVLETAEGVELWSYRHSGVIQEFRVSE